MQVIYQLIYEYQKQMRDLCLVTVPSELKNKIEIILKKHLIEYKIQNIENKINVFFGNPNCIKILKNFSSIDLDKLTPQEDFILGIMLGYGKTQQYQRFLKRIKDCVTNC